MNSHDLSNELSVIQVDITDYLSKELSVIRVAITDYLSISSLSWSSWHHCSHQILQL